MPKVSRFCIICDKPLHSPKIGTGNPEHHTDITNAPSGATIWSTPGNYGSSVFDPIEGNVRLEIAICDDCLFERANRVTEYSVRNQQIVENVQTFGKKLAKERKAEEKLKRELAKQIPMFGRVLVTNPPKASAHLRNKYGTVVGRAKVEQKFAYTVLLDDLNECYRLFHDEVSFMGEVMKKKDLYPGKSMKVVVDKHGKGRVK